MTSVMHRCRQTEDPRKPGRCACGKALELPRYRNLESEQEITRWAVQGLIDPDPLIEFAEARAAALHGKYTDDPMVIADRDRPREAMEEAADARNHLVWHLQANPADQHAMNALFYFIRAYEELRMRRADQGVDCVD